MNDVKQCTKCHEVKPLEEFSPHKGTRDGRRSRCRVCDAKRSREAYWKKQGIPESDWPRLHQEVDARAARRDSVPDGFKACARCHEVKPLDEFPPDKRARDGRDPRCRVCNAKRLREAHWKKQNIPPEEWPRLHQEADRKAETQTARRNSAPDGFKACARCHEVKPLAEFPPRKGARDGRDSRCRVCHTKCGREAYWKKQGIPESDWPRLHQEADRQRRMRELAAQHGLKHCPGCDMCLGRRFFRRKSSRADGLSQYCKACDSARAAAYLRTDAGRAAAKGRDHRRRARVRDLPTDGSGPRDWAAHAEEVDDFCCHLCGGELTAADVIHWDHLDPISTGTTGTVLHNMHAAHATCNLSRGNRPLTEWWDSVERPDEAA